MDAAARADLTGMFNCPHTGAGLMLPALTPDLGSVLIGHTGHGDWP